jgi:hypothetical protein
MDNEGYDKSYYSTILLSCKSFFLHTKISVLCNCSIHKTPIFVCKKKRFLCNCSIIITLPVVLYECETWSLTLREERKLRVFENMVLMRIFGPSRDEVTGEWRRLHNEKLNDLYSSPNIVRVIKSIRMRWAGYVAHMSEERGCIGSWSWWGNRRERDHLGDLGVNGWIILGRISRRWDVGIWTGLGWSRIETGGGRL